jgi:ubiquinone/menaquinone biosynthesis C-methylase UbiE
MYTTMPRRKKKRMTDWEAPDPGQLARLLAGDHYGERPEDILDEIRARKKAKAAYLCRKMGCRPESIVLEVGSGMGLTSKHVAGQVKHLYCSDVSASFLEAARKECAGVPNIDFIRIGDPPVFDFEDEFFDIVFADAVFIHLNLYDIYWYFSEFQRLVRRRGKVFINIMNGAAIDARKLSQMADFYRKRKANLPRLLCWNSTEAVVTVASRFGFDLKARSRRWWPRQGGATIDLLFSKR